MNYWGDNLRFFVGRVLKVDNDPEARGRAQIFIFGIHSDNPTDMSHEDFPWAEVMLPTTDGGVSGLNSSGGPGLVETASVFGVFLDGQVSQLPVILGTLPKIDQIRSYTPRAYRSINDGKPELVAEGEGSGSWGGVFTPDELRTAVANDSSPRTTRLALMYFFTKQKTLDPTTGKEVPAFTPKQAAGIVGNLQGENSQFDPKLQSTVSDSYRSGLFTQQFGEEGLARLGVPELKSNEPSYGIAQWNANVNRFQHLFEYAKQRKQPWDDLWLQAEFICWELFGSGSQKTGAGSHKHAYRALRQTNSHVGGMNNQNSSTWIWMKKYEVAAITPAKLGQRERFAIEALADYENAISQAAGVS